MSNPILSSNQSSAVVATINESTTKNPWVYNETDRLTVPHAMQLLTFHNSSGSIAQNSMMTFDLPKNGILQQLFFVVEAKPADRYTTGTGASEVSIGYTKDGEVVNGLDFADDQKDTLLAEMHVYGALRMIKSIRLTASGRIIEQLDQQQMFARYSDMPVEHRMSVATALRMRGQRVASEYETAFPIPLPFYFARDQQRYGLLTNFEEPFRVEITFSDTFILSDAGTLLKGTGVQFEPSKAYMVGHYRQLDEPQMNEVVSKNYGDGLLSRVVDIAKREAPMTITSGVSTTTLNTIEMTLKENEAVRAMYVMVTCGSSMVVDNDAPVQLHSIQLTFNNTVVLDVPAHLIRCFGRWGQGHSHGSGDPGSVALTRMQNVYKIDFGLAYDKGLSNVVALREIASPKLKVQWYTQATKNPAGTSAFNNGARPSTLHVLYDTATFLSTSSSTGRVQLSISS